MHRPLGGAFTRLWLASSASNLSDGIRVAALPLLAATLSASPTAVALVYVAGELPWLLFGLVSGGLVDRFDRRTLIAVAHAVRVVTVAGLAIAVGLGLVSIPLLCAVAFVLGTSETVFDNASQAIVPDLVPRERVEDANVRQELALIGGNQLIGPPLGAALFAAAAVRPFFADAVLLAMATILVLSLPRPAAHTAPSGSPRPSLRRELADGVAWLRSHAFLRRVTLLGAGVNFSVMLGASVLVLLALREVGVTGLGYGALLSAYAVGGIVGGLTASRLCRAVGRSRAIVLVVVGAGIAQLLTAQATSGMGLAVWQALLGVCGSSWAVMTLTLRQSLAPPAMLGRIIGAHRVLSWGAGAVGALLGGILASAAGLRAPFLLSGGLLVVLAAVAAIAFWNASPIDES